MSVFEREDLFMWNIGSGAAIEEDEFKRGFSPLDYLVVEEGGDDGATGSGVEGS